MTFKDNAAINFNIFQNKKCSFVSNMTGHTVVVTACNCYEDIQKTVVKAVSVFNLHGAGCQLHPRMLS
jgi:hypothetical protein